MPNRALQPMMPSPATAEKEVGTDTSRPTKVLPHLPLRVKKPCNANALHGRKSPWNLLGGESDVNTLIANGF